MRELIPPHKRTVELTFEIFIRIVKHDNHCNCPINYIKLRGLDEYKAFEFHFIKKEQGEYKWQH